MKWIHKKDSYSGNVLETIIDLGGDEVLKCELYYRDYAPAGRQYWSISYQERKELGYEIVLNVNKMRREPNFLVGGIGKFMPMEAPRVHRKTLKPLKDVAESLTAEYIKSVGLPQTTEPSRIVG